MAEQESWLPNLVGGVSIWKLAVDLNDPKFMDGRLLEPETEGSDSLPARVSWDLTGLVVLGDARRDHAAGLEQAIAEFFACLEKVREQLEDEDSGYHQYQEAFTVPGLDVDDGGNYFFGPEDGKLYVINWGASPRSIKHEQAFLFGYDSFRDLYDREGIEPAVAGAASASAADASGSPAEAPAEEGGGQAAADPVAPDDKKDDDKKGDEKEEKEEDGEGRPWWVWLLVALAAIALVVILLLLLQQCDEQKTGQDGADGGTASADAGAGGGGGSGGDSAAAISDGGAAGHGGAGGEGGHGGAGGAGGEGGHGGAGGAGGSGDGSGAAAPVTPAPGVEPGSGGACGGTVKVIVGGGSGPAKPVTPAPGQSHRAHFHPKAIAWRVQEGYQHVDHVETDKSTYHVFLKPGATFENVRVQWQDRNGQWHDH